MDKHLVPSTVTLSNGEVVELSDENRARIAARRSAKRMTRTDEADALNAATAAKLDAAARTFGEDAVQAAYLRALDRGENDPTTYAYQWARREHFREGRASIARRRREGMEFKYADRWAPADPTAAAAIDNGTARVLLQVDTFAFPCTGRRGAMVAWDEAAAALGANAESLQVATAGALHAARPGDVVKRARAAGVSAADLATAATAAEASTDRVPVCRPARTVPTVDRPTVWYGGRRVDAATGATVPTITGRTLSGPVARRIR